MFIQPIVKVRFGSLLLCVGLQVGRYGKNQERDSLTPYWPGVSGLVSVLTFAIVISLSSAIECRTGEIILQGPHQGAQKSTNTHSDSEITD